MRQLTTWVVVLRGLAHLVLVGILKIPSRAKLTQEEGSLTSSPDQKQLRRGCSEMLGGNPATPRLEKKIKGGNATTASFKGGNPTTVPGSVFHARAHLSENLTQGHYKYVAYECSDADADRGQDDDDDAHYTRHDTCAFSTEGPEQSAGAHLLFPPAHHNMSEGKEVQEGWDEREGHGRGEGHAALQLQKGFGYMIGDAGVDNDLLCLCATPTDNDISLRQVRQASARQHKGKSPGPDSLTPEAAYNPPIHY